MIVKQASLPLFWLIKSHIGYAPFNHVMLNTRVRHTVYVRVRKKHGLQAHVLAKLVKTLSASM